VVEKGSGKAESAAQKKPFELIAGHPALDLVNTLDWRFRDGRPEELIMAYEDLLRFVVQSGLITAAEGRRLLRSADTDSAEQALAHTRELREAEARVLYAALDGEGPPAEAVRRLECYFKEAEEHRRLSWSKPHLRWGFPSGLTVPELPLWILALKTAKLMTSDSMDMIRACGNPECRWLFLDTSKNHTRRWCDMKICGNRMKARRFKAQHR
jgi:predicted RNA-binding Zn ribbon-like protein